MPGETKVTRRHEEIRRWAEERGGRPTMAGDDPALPGDRTGGLRVSFMRGDGASREVSWDEFFQEFDRRNLVMVYQDDTDGGKLSRYCKVVSRHEAPQAAID